MTLTLFPDFGLFVVKVLFIRVFERLWLCHCHVWIIAYIVHHEETINNMQSKITENQEKHHEMIKEKCMIIFDLNETKDKNEQELKSKQPESVKLKNLSTATRLN